jgi:5-methylcytosine-specific restriction enzyme B
MVDYALRRRFAFVTLRPGFETDGFQRHLRTKGAETSLIRQIVMDMAALNQAITDDRNLGEGFVVGHSYFCETRGSVDRAWYRRVIRSEIIPLLQEYWFDDKPKVSDWQEKLLAE